MTRTGDSFDAWVRPHLTAMQRYAARLTCPADAEDIVQEALVRAWRRRSTYDADRGEPLVWLLAIVRDRAHRVRPQRVLALTEHDRAVELHPEDIDLTRALGGPSPRQREAVDLYYFIDLDVATIAGLMGCAEGTVRATLHQARLALRQMLETEHD
jgi:RNA polymerase sigma-70 factor (ECF subfamily)